MMQATKPKSITITNGGAGISNVPLSSIDVLAPYMAEIRTVDLLDREEEKTLADAIKKDDEQAYNSLITANLRLVVKIAHSFRGYGLPLADLISEGNIGLMRAAAKFDPSKGAKFSSYAAWWIKQSMRKALTNQSRTIRIPVQGYQRIKEIKQARQDLAKELGRDPSDAELAEKLNMTKRNVTALRLADISCVSLQSSIKEGEDGELMELVPDESAERPEHVVADTDLVFQVMDLLDRLPERERYIIDRRYGLRGSAMTLDQVSSVLGISKERVRQLQVRALKSLQQWLAETGQGFVFGNPVVEDEDDNDEDEEEYFGTESE